MVILQRFISDLRALITDPRCEICNRPLTESEAAICDDCLARLRLFDIRHLTTPHSFLDYRLEHIGRVVGASALMIYKKGDISQSLIHDLKYHGCRSHARLFGRAMAERIAANPIYSNIDYIVPVPLYRTKQRSRGYNQSEEVARIVSRLTHIPLSTGNLIRFRNTKSQAGSDITDRLAFRYAFKVKDPQQYDGKRIMLIDDVYTSGSTIIDCCRALDAVPRLEILVYTLAYSEN